MFFNHRNLNKVLRDAGRPEILHTFDVWHMIKVIPKLITFVPSPVESQVFFNKDFEFFLNPLFWGIGKCGMLNSVNAKYCTQN